MRLHRLPFVLALLALVLVALAVGNAAGSPAAPASDSPDAGLESAQSGVWFCPGLPPQYQGVTGRVTFANVSMRPSDVTVTNLPDKGEPTRQQFRVAANTVVTKARNALGGPGALTVETFGARVAVEEGVTAPRAFESAACAADASPHWYFPAGTTPRGVRQWLNIDNPYAADAKVNVTLRTANGLRRLDRLEGLDIARRTRLFVPIESAAVREAQVAVQVDAVAGAVVAAQTMTFDADTGTPGVAHTLGAPAAASRWTFAGSTATNANAIVAIMGVGDDDVAVDVQAVADGNEPVPPVTVNVARDTPTWVTLGGCSPTGGKACLAVSNGTRYTLIVRSEDSAPVVAQVLARSDALGVVTVMGTREPRPQWVFAASRVAGEQATTLAVYNPDAAEARVSIGLVRGGRVSRPGRLGRINVPAGGRVNVTVFDEGTLPPAETALLVQSTGRVFVERTIVVGDEAARATGASFR